MFHKGQKVVFITKQVELLKLLDDVDGWQQRLTILRQANSVEHSKAQRVQHDIDYYVTQKAFHAARNKYQLAVAEFARENPPKELIREDS